MFRFTSATHTLTVHLSNPASLVVHVFALGSDITGPRSTSALAAGSYTGHFQYSGAIGWQIALVGLKPPAAQSAGP